MTENVFWFEMVRRDPGQGGEGWERFEALWSPSRKTDGRRWAFWETVLQVSRGDLILHLVGKDTPEFTGYSVADSDGYETTRRPPRPGPWAYADSFYRVSLTDYVPFPSPIDLEMVFARRNSALRAYFNRNRDLPSSQKKRLFYVIQSNRLQCLNGAYCSEVDAELAGLLLGDNFVRPHVAAPADSDAVIEDVRTGEQIQRVATRVGQDAFSEAVRANYGSRCCFSDCDVAEDTFLVSSHIARWADVPGLRGELANGLCLCLMHDKAFEDGLFTLTPDYTVWVNQTRAASSEWAVANLLPCHGRPAKPGKVRPSREALEIHWERTGCKPREG